MRPETAIIEIHGQYRIHTEFYGNPAAQQTIILVNGSLSTTASFAQTVKYLQPHYNVVLYDQPYAGQSKPHNENHTPISKECEARILLELIERFRAEVVMSFSWGGVATLLALAQRPGRIRRAVVNSFSPQLNPAMLDYLHRGLDYLAACDRTQIGNLVNETIGRYLPQLFKRYNFRHVSSLDEHEYHQMHFHIREVLRLNADSYTESFAGIEIPVLFMNGELDIYTTPHEARQFGQLIRGAEFHTIRNAGHFIDVEHKAAWQQTQDALLAFLRPQRTQPLNPIYRPQPNGASVPSPPSPANRHRHGSPAPGGKTQRNQQKPRPGFTCRRASGKRRPGRKSRPSGRRIMALPELPKLMTRVRFPSPAPDPNAKALTPTSARGFLFSGFTA